VRAAQKLLGALTIGGGVPGQGVVAESNTPPSCPECTVMRKNRRFSALIDLEIAKNAVVFYLKVLKMIYS
jgi:hypothetical protein